MDEQDGILEEAALWLAAHLDADEATLERDPWVRADPARHAAVLALLHMNNNPALDHALRLSERARPVRAARRPRPAVFGYWPAALAACTLLVAVLLFRPDAGVPTATYQTARGESRVVQLADGSSLTLGGDTVLTVTLRPEQRHVDLARGAVLFDVARDTARPFIVDTGDSRTMVLGTRFVLDRYGDGTELSVYAGRVRFGPPDRGGVEATAGQRVSLLSGRLGEVGHFDAAAEGWRSDWIDTTGISLGRLVEELNRWSDRPVELADPALAQLQVSGYFRLTETTSQLERIALLHRLDLVRHDDRYVLTRSPTTAKPF